MIHCKTHQTSTSDNVYFTYFEYIIALYVMLSYGYQWLCHLESHKTKQFGNSESGKN